jgi:ABC-type transport system involved in multi-copper enzyme maturation permease subunit
MRIAELFTGVFAVFNFDNRSVIRGVYIPRALLISNIILAIVVIVLMYKNNSKDEMVYFFNYSTLSNDMRLMFFSGLALIQAFIIILLPARTANVIIEEKEKENIDHIFLTKLSSFQLVIGKLLSSTGIYLMFLITAIPVLAIMICYSGGVSIDEFFISILIIILNIFKLSAICIYLSVRVKKPAQAITFSYISIIMLFFILPSFFTKYTVFNEMLYSGYPNIFNDFFAVSISLLPLLVFVGFLIAEFFFVIQRHVESWKSYIVVSIIGVLLLIWGIFIVIIEQAYEGFVPYLNPIEFFVVFLYPELFNLYGSNVLTKPQIYSAVIQYSAVAIVSSFAILYLAARRLDVLRWGRV